MELQRQRKPRRRAARYGRRLDTGGIAICLLLVFAPPSMISAQSTGGALQIPVLMDADLEGWRDWKFSGATEYTRVFSQGRPVIKAVSNGAASGVYRKIRIDLGETPVIHWNWRVENTLGAIDETRRQGDDYSARIYVMVAHPVFFWKTYALTYVWSSAQPAGSAWPNAYSDGARVIAVRSGDAGLGEWHRERRDVRADFKRYFGKEVRYANAVAVMTDTDDTGKQAVAYYGDIWFSAR
jgi:hypothetical protein